jgi:hypothetical protein
MCSGSNLQMALVGAAKGGSLPVLHLLLGQAAHLGLTIDRFEVATVAAENGHLKAVRWLVHLESDPSFQDILHATAEQDWQAVLGLVKDQTRPLPLGLLFEYAVDHLGSAGVQALIQCGATTSAEGPSLAAARQGKPRCLQLLLQHGYGVWGSQDMLAAVERGHRRCVQLLLPAYSEPHSWRRRALCTAAAHGYWRILQLLLNYIEHQPAHGSLLHAEDLAAAICNAAGRSHLQCARLLLDRVAQACLDPHVAIGLDNPNANQGLDYSLAYAAKAGDWQMVELMTTAKWPDPLCYSPAPGAGVHQIRFGPNWTSALAALVDPGAADKAEKNLKAQLYPLYRQAPPITGSGRAAHDGQQGPSTSSAGCNHSAGGGGIGSGGAGPGNIPVNVGTSPDASEVEVEVEEADEAEPPSSQQHTPSRSKAAVLLLRAGAKVEGNVSRWLDQLAECSEELRELLSTHVPAATSAGM